MASILVVPGFYTAVVEAVEVGMFRNWPSVAIRFYCEGKAGQPPFRGLTRVNFEPDRRGKLTWAVRYIRSVGFEGDDLLTLDSHHPNYQDITGRRFTLEAVTRVSVDDEGRPRERFSLFSVYAPVDPPTADSVPALEMVSRALREGGA